MSTDTEPPPARHRRGRRSLAAEKHVGEVRSDIGMAFQHFDQFPHMTASENITPAPIKVRRMSKPDDRSVTMELLDEVGLAAHADHTPGQLSGRRQ